jgi:GNAT superfamily N-acetyltransferase
MENIDIEQVQPEEAEKLCRKIMATLPEWFGQPEANESYANGTLERVTLVAKNELEKPVGMITLEFPFANNSHIYWVAVKKDYHGKGIGTKLMVAAEEYCRSHGCASLTVKTISTKNSDVYYLKTMHYFLKCGFKPLFELPTQGPDSLMVYLHKNIYRLQFNANKVMKNIKDQLVD